MLLKLLSFAAEIAFGKLIWLLIHFGESDFFVLIVSSLAFSLAHVFGDQDCFFFFLFIFFSSNKFVRCGVVNALIKGEIEMPVC